MPDKLRSGQVKQKNIEYPPEGNGWPDALVSNDNPVGTKVSVGSNGGSQQMDGLSTSQSKTGGWSLTEGTPAEGATQPNTNADKSVRSGNPLQTSQQAIGGHHKVEGE